MENLLLSIEIEEAMEKLHQCIEKIRTLEARLEEQQELTQTLKGQLESHELQMNIERRVQDSRFHTLERQLNQLQDEQQRQARLALPPAPTSNQPQQPPSPPPAVAQAAASAAATQAAPFLTITSEQGRGRGSGRGRGRGRRHERHYRIQGMDFWGHLRQVTPNGFTIEL
ncbi:hypothetical protein J3E68DRAFT_399437 [Trichoderma sp. SZMC 28012]